MKKVCFILLILFYTTASFSQKSDIIFWGDTIFSIPTNGIVNKNGNVIITASGYFNDIYDYRGIVLKINEGEVSSYYTHPQVEDTATMYLNITQLDNENYLCVGAYRIGTEIDIPLPVFFTLLDSNLNFIEEKSFYLPPEYSTGSYFYSLYESPDTLLYAFTARKPTMQNGKWALGLLRATSEGDTIETSFHEINQFQYFNNDCDVADLVYDSINDKYLVSVKIGTMYYKLIYIDKSLNVDTIYSYDYPPPYYNMDGKRKFGFWIDNEKYITSCDGFLDSKGDMALYAGIHDIYGNIPDYIVLNTGVQDQSAFNCSIAAANDSTIYILGHDMCISCNYMTDVDFIEVFTINSSLDVLGYNVIADDGYYKSFNVLTNDAGDLIVIGTKNVSDTSYLFNIFVSIIPREELGLTTSVKTIKNDNFRSNPYPNPASDKICFPLASNILSKGVKLIFHTFSGKTALSKPITGTGNCIEVDIGNLPKGMYIYEIIYQNRKIDSGKFIKN